MTVRQMRRTMLATEFQEWMGLYMLEATERKDEAAKAKRGGRKPRRRGRRR